MCFEHGDTVIASPCSTSSALSSSSTTAVSEASINNNSMDGAPPSAVQTAAYDEEELWYHPHVDREGAERLLLGDRQGVDGLFLVRDSGSAPGDLVLSVRVGAGVLHYQLHQHDGDALYSVNEGPRVHGVDALVSRYRDRASSDRLAVTLGPCVRGQAAPSALCRQGTGNLLHRAAVGGHTRVVAALIQAGYPQLHAKDELGRTAVHLAAELDRGPVLHLLLAAGCTAGARDARGLTPLHHAARHDAAASIHLLVEEGQACVAARQPGTNWLPLHEAAHAGAERAARALLAQRAALRPRDLQGRTPAQLAAAAGHSGCRLLLQHHVQPVVPRRVRSQFLHSRLSRLLSRQRLTAAGLSDGDFLVRSSARHPGRLVLSMAFSERVYNYEVRRISRASVDGEGQEEPDEDGGEDGDETDYFFIDDGPYLDSLEHLVEHYSCVADGLVCRLSHPVSPPAEEAARAITERRSVLLGLEADCKAPPDEPVGSSGLLCLQELEFGSVIGRGEFGRVYHGCWRQQDACVPVAIKRRRGEVLAGDASRGVWREAACLQQLCHPAVVRFVGVVQHCERLVLLVQELAPLGSLLAYVRGQPSSRVTARDMRVWCGQVADGMAYMASRRVVHRDLAARNILLASPGRAKISDFGFSLILPADSDYYRVSSGGRWPVKWYAPESMNYGTFSSRSDVWSFGVLAWEVYSGGEVPYGAVSGVDAFLELVERGSRLLQPSQCPMAIYQLMLKCWAYDARERPSFPQLHDFLSDEEGGASSWLAEPRTITLTAADMARLVAAEGLGTEETAEGLGTEVADVLGASVDTVAAADLSQELYDSPRCHSLVRPSRKREVVRHRQEQAEPVSTACDVTAGGDVITEADDCVRRLRLSDSASSSLQHFSSTSSSLQQFPSTSFTSSCTASVQRRSSSPVHPQQEEECGHDVGEVRKTGEEPAPLRNDLSPTAGDDGSEACSEEQHMLYDSPRLHSLSCWSRSSDTEPV